MRDNPTWAIVALAAALALAACEAEPAAGLDPPLVPGEPGLVLGPGSESKKAVMHTGRIGASATVLEDGRIVIIGGAIPKDDADARAVAEGRPEALGTILDTVEIYDPTTGQVTQLATDPVSPQTLFYPRAFHEAVLFPGAGRIVVFGGYAQVGSVTSATPSVEIFRVEELDFQTLASSPPMSKPRVHHTASLLDYRNADGVGDVFVLLAGGEGDARVSYEVWKPGTGIIRSGGIPVAPRWNHRAVNVEGYYTLLVGGEDADSTVSAIDVFDRDKGVFLPNGQLPQSLQLGGRVGHSVAHDPESRVLYVIGGYGDKAKTELLRHIEVISTATGASLAPKSANFVLNEPRAWHQSVTLADGRVLVTGGLGPEGTLVPVTEVVGSTGGQIAAIKGVSLIPSRFAHKSVAMSADVAVILGGGAPRSGGGVALETTIDVVRTP